jgi:hypothetical protein
MNPIDTSQLNNSSRKTWNWSIRYGIDQLNSPIDQLSRIVHAFLGSLIEVQKVDCIDL